MLIKLQVFIIFLCDFKSKRSINLLQKKFRVCELTNV